MRSRVENQIRSNRENSKPLENGKILAPLQNRSINDTTDIHSPDFQIFESHQNKTQIIIPPLKASSLTRGRSASSPEFLKGQSGEDVFVDNLKDESLLLPNLQDVMLSSRKLKLNRPTPDGTAVKSQYSNSELFQLKSDPDSVSIPLFTDVKSRRTPLPRNLPPPHSESDLNPKTFLSSPPLPLTRARLEHGLSPGLLPFSSPPSKSQLEPLPRRDREKDKDGEHPRLRTSASQPVYTHLPLVEDNSRPMIKSSTSASLTIPSAGSSDTSSSLDPTPFSSDIPIGWSALALSPSPSQPIIGKDQQAVLNDDIVNERLQQAKALVRKGEDSGATMHKFSLWKKQPQTQQAPSQTQSQPTIIHPTASSIPDPSQPTTTPPTTTPLTTTFPSTPKNKSSNSNYSSPFEKVDDDPSPGYSFPSSHSKRLTRLRERNGSADLIDLPTSSDSPDTSKGRTVARHREGAQSDPAIKFTYFNLPRPLQSPRETDRSDHEDSDEEGSTHSPPVKGRLNFLRSTLSTSKQKPSSHRFPNPSATSESEDDEAEEIHTEVDPDTVTLHGDLSFNDDLDGQSVEEEEELKSNPLRPNSNYKQQPSPNRIFPLPSDPVADQSTLETNPNPTSSPTKVNFLPISSEILLTRSSYDDCEFLSREGSPALSELSHMSDLEFEDVQPPPRVSQPSDHVPSQFQQLTIHTQFDSAPQLPAPDPNSLSSATSLFPPPRPSLTTLYTDPEGCSEDSPIRWKKGHTIGEGTFGKVFKGLNERTGESLAVKQFYLAHDSDSEVASLRKEIAVMWHLRHENIVRYIGTAHSDRYLYIILEYVPGGSISSMLSQFGALSDELTRRFTRQILLGVQYLHRQDIVHRDIKGANVLVTDSGVAKLSDFGCSKKLVDVCSHSLEESLRAIRGSVPWMSPEVIKQTVRPHIVLGLGHGIASDIWSVGCTVLEMTTAHPPWPEFNNNLAILFHVATLKADPAPPLSLSSSCQHFLSRCLVLDPEVRSSASDLLDLPFVLEEK